MLQLYTTSRKSCTERRDANDEAYLGRMSNMDFGVRIALAIRVQALQPSSFIYLQDCIVQILLAGFETGRMEFASMHFMSWHKDSTKHSESLVLNVKGKLSYCTVL